MTETVKTHICSYDEKDTDKILDSDYWDDIQKDKNSDTYYLYKDSVYLNFYSEPEKHRECVAINSKRDIIVVYTYKDSYFCNDVVQHFRDIHNIDISVYAPTYTELCSLLRSSDELIVYGLNPETNEVEELSEVVTQGKNPPVTNASLEWYNNFELSMRFNGDNFQIKTNESNTEEFHKTEEFEKYIDLITTHFSL